MRRSLLSFALIALTLPAAGQSFTPVREQKNLSPAAITRLHALETLNALPPGDWRFHAGDIPHGESPTLDDSAWPTLSPDSKPRPRVGKEAAWFRRTIEVPKTLHGYDLTGSRILFQFQADANGPMPQIIYFNGRRVALGDDLEPIVLFEPAHPGEKILVAVKLLHTVDDKTFSGVSLRIQPGSNSKRIDPNDIRVQIVTAANILPALPTPRRDLLPTVEQAAAAINTTALAAGNQLAFDASLRRAQSILSPLQPVLAQAKFDLAGNSHIDAAWLWPRSETIDVVKRTFTTALQLMDEYPDYTFTQSAAQYSEWMAEKYPALNAQIAQRVKEGRWQIVGGMWVEPDLNLPGGESLVRQLLVGQRKFKDLYGVTARIGWNPDSFGYNWQLPQIYKRSGMDYFVTQKMHWNDTNILPFRLFWWQSPDGSKVLTYFPTDYVHDNVNPTRISYDFAESAERNPGTTEHLDLYGIGDHGGGPTRAMLDQADHFIALSQASVPGAPGQQFTASAKNGYRPMAVTGGPALPTIRYSTPQAFFTSVETHLNPDTPLWNYDKLAQGWTAPPMAANLSSFAAGGGSASPATSASDPLIGLPTWNDELYFEYHRGIYTTQAAHKRNMRTSETATLNAEKLASLAWLLGDKLDGKPYPAAVLTENWKKITFNQFHDLAAGSGIGVIYKDAQRDYDEVFNEDHKIASSALQAMSARIDTRVKGATPILVFNSLAWPRTETVALSLQMPDTTETVKLLDDKNQPVPSQVVSQEPVTHQFTVIARVAVPAFGYAVLHAEKGSADPASALKLTQDASAFTLANAQLKVTIDRESGCITSLLSGASEAIAPAACGNQLQTYADNPKNYDAWNIDPGTLDGPMTPIDALDSITVLTDGPLRKTIRIDRTWSKSHFTQDISLDAGGDAVRIENTVDWHEDHVLLKAAFPLAHTSNLATYEIPFGAIARRTTHNNSFEKARFEVPAQNWADLGDATAGLSLLNDSKYAYDAVGNVLRLTLLRAPTWPDPVADRGMQHFTYALYPHTGAWQQSQTVHRGLELNTPLMAQQVFEHSGTLPATHSFVSVAEPNLILTAIKKSEDTGALIFRVYDATGQGGTLHLTLPPGAQTAMETNLMETPIPGADHLPLSGDVVTLAIKPWEIRTIQATYPATSK